MTERSFPFVDGVTTDAEFSALFRDLFPSSVRGFYGSSALQVTADSSGLKVGVEPGDGFVRGHFYRNSDRLELDITPNTSGQTRIDTVVLHLEYGSLQAIEARVIAGAPGLGAPALTQTISGIYQLPLSNTTVPAGAATIGPGALTDRRKWWGLEFMRAMGLVIGPTAPGPDQAFVHLRTQ